MPVAAPSDKRFRRARISPTRRSPRRPWWRALVGMALVVSALVYASSRLVHLASESPALTVRRVSVSGNARLSTGEVRALLEGLQGSSLVTLDLDRWRRTLLSSPWIAAVDIRRVFPDTVAVVLTEREAAAVARVDGALYVIDHGGAIIEEFGPDHAGIDVPIVDGLATARSGELLVDESRARLAGRFLAALRPHPGLAARISQIDVTDERDAVVVLKDDTARVHLGTEHFAERLQSYVDLAAHLRQRVPDIDYVDLRYGDRVYVKPHAAASAEPRGRRG